MATGSKVEFAETLAARLEQAAQSRFGRLYLAAPPHFLGYLRKALGDRAGTLLCGTNSKDLTKHPAAEIAQYLQEGQPGY